MEFGIIGGTGPQGQGLALRLAQAGFRVIIGSRTLEKAKKISGELNTKLSSRNITGMANVDVVRSTPIVFLTIPYESVADTLKTLIDTIKENTKIFVDVTVPMKFEKGRGMVFDSPEQGSMSNYISQLIDPVPVIGAFKTISARALNEYSEPLNRDTFIYGPKTYKKEIMDLVSKIETLTPIDAGGLSAGETVERLVPFLINLNRRYKVKDSGFKIIMQNGIMNE